MKPVLKQAPWWNNTCTVCLKLCTFSAISSTANASLSKNRTSCSSSSLASASMPSSSTLSSLSSSRNCRLNCLQRLSKELSREMMSHVQITAPKSHTVMPRGRAELSKRCLA